MAHTLFAKQPIFDAQLNIQAYELLFRNNSNNAAQFTDGDQATSHVLLYAFGQHNISDIVGEVPAFVNFTQNMLMFPPPLCSKKLVIEVLEDVIPDQLLIDNLKKLKELGYTIALDDFFLTKETKQLAAYADIIKIDVLALSEEQLKKYATKLKPLNIQLLAEKIETHEMFELCKGLGFELFQGYFLSKPKIVEGKILQGSKQSILRLLATLTEPSVEMKTLSNVIASDPHLSYRILKIINSSAYSTPCKVGSLTQAVSLLGLDKIRNWAMVMVLADDDSKPQELGVLGMTRAKFGEFIGEVIENADFAEQCFTTGVLSTFDAFLDIPMEQLISKLPLTQNMAQGLVHHQGSTGRVLQLIKHYESADWNTVNTMLEDPFFGKLDEPTLNNCYTEAVCWAQSTISAL